MSHLIITTHWHTVSQEQQVMYKCGVGPKTPLVGQTLRDAHVHGPQLHFCQSALWFAGPQLASQKNLQHDHLWQSLRQLLDAEEKTQP